MSLRSEVADAARRAVAALPVELVDAAEDAIDSAATHWQHATQGGLDDAVSEVHTRFEAVKDDLHAVRQLLAQVPVRVEAWIAGLGGHRVPDGSPTVAEPPDHTTLAPTQAERAQLFERARAELPVPLDHGRTSGAWVAPDGTVVPLVSGENSRWFGVAAKHAQALGLCRPIAPPTLARHVEIQFAMRMREMTAARPPGAEPMRETIVINRKPCGIDPPPQDLSCDKHLAVFLPPGAELTVVVRDGSSYTYRGVEQ
ncbi:DddA-like double-stranded DNA deaminase toxin [Allokutzneria oryzae]|uniref:DddA-like double-stranded DNA deaminase toxin n=1 Tax=Allokutzneria oryzae TaxID=1378989 RepID=A0ABV5ZZN8_9PSEU